MSRLPSFATGTRAFTSGRPVFATLALLLLVASVGCGDSETGGLGPSAPTDFDLAVEGLDSQRAVIEARLQETPGDWALLEQLANLWSRRARLTGQINDYEAADQAMVQAYAAAEVAKPWLSRALLSYTLHRLDEAEEALDALEAIPLLAGRSRSEILGLRGDIAFHRSDYADSLRLYREALEVKSSFENLFRLSLYYSKTGDVVESMRYLSLARARVSSSDAFARAWLTFQEGVMALERDELDEARRLLSEANQGFSGWYLIEEHLAEVDASTGRYLEAELAYRDIVERTELPEFMDALAGVLDAQGKDEEAALFRSRARAGFEEQLRRLPSAASGHALDHFLESSDPSRALSVALDNHTRRPNGEAKLKLAQAYALQENGLALVPLQEVLESPFRTLELGQTCRAVLAVVSVEATHPVATGCATVGNQ